MPTWAATPVAEAGAASAASSRTRSGLRRAAACPVPRTTCTGSKWEPSGGSTDECADALPMGTSIGWLSGGPTLSPTRILVKTGADVGVQVPSGPASPCDPKGETHAYPARALPDSRPDHPRLHPEPAR